MGRGRWPARRSLARCRPYGRFASRGPPCRVTASPAGLHRPAFAVLAHRPGSPAMRLPRGRPRAARAAAGAAVPCSLPALRPSTLRTVRQRRITASPMGLPRPAFAALVHRPGSPAMRVPGGRPGGARAVAGAAVPCLLPALRPSRFARSALPGHGIADGLAPARLRGPGASPPLACDALDRSRKEEGEEGKQSFRWRKTC